MNISIIIYIIDIVVQNVRKIIFRGKNPTDEEVDNMLNQLTSSGQENVKLLAVEFED